MFFCRKMFFFCRNSDFFIRRFLRVLAVKINSEQFFVKSRTAKLSGEKFSPILSGVFDTTEAVCGCPKFLNFRTLLSR